MLAKAVLILLVVTLSAPWASAQSTFGDVVGVVKDQNQGVVELRRQLPRPITDAVQ